MSLSQLACESGKGLMQSVDKCPRGGGGGNSAYERDGDARRLAKGCKFRILVSFRVFWAKRHHI